MVKLPSQPPENDASLRAFLLAEVLCFVRRASQCPGVRRIALVGSLTRDKADPKDADVLVTVDDDADLSALASAGRALKGRAQSRNKGADIFLADLSGHYIGRTCQWKKCRPGIRAACDAFNCGRRAFLHDDLGAIALDDALIKAPPIELWPKLVLRVEVPGDVESELIRPLAESNAGL